MDKIVTTRKDHECCYCRRVIPKGSKALYIEGKEPRYDDEFEDQIGIKYYRVWLCHNDPVCLRTGRLEIEG